ncbi:hypothetical protein BOX15_Mlig020427g1 [Macrostomum lignano]|uniref:Glutathione transferase n=2 Tax=Macrostomum lignano TaxID=282301 RepID=A0A1I8H018_9PLAT|nr:hypothetical protein BOX15_Mlig020427g1 [Macrostomum lignano]
MSYKLYYFDGRGRGEIIRLVFAAAGVDFEDIRFDLEEWESKYRAISPTGLCPYLVDPVTGKTLVQSGAIARLLAARSGLAASDEQEFYRVERILHQLTDIEDLAIDILFGPEEKRPAFKKEFLETKAPYHFGILAGYLREASDSKFAAAGKSLTLADLALINLIDFMEFIGPEAQELAAGFVEFAAHRKHALESNKKLADYLANRKPGALPF